MDEKERIDALIAEMNKHDDTHHWDKDPQYENDAQAVWMFLALVLIVVLWGLAIWMVIQL